MPKMPMYASALSRTRPSARRDSADFHVLACWRDRRGTLAEKERRAVKDKGLHVKLIGGRWSEWDREDKVLDLEP